MEGIVIVFKMKIGYHYTTLENYKKIKKEGLIPYPITHPDFKNFDKRKAIFIWKKRLIKDAHVGSIFYQMAKNKKEVVLLKLKLDEAGCKDKNGDSFNLSHDGMMDKLKYHNHEKAILYFKTIQPKDIQLIGRYKFGDAWR